MERVPPTEKTELEKIQDEIEIEAAEWQRVGMTGNMTIHSPESHWISKIQIQAMMNIILMKGLCTQEEMNIQFKRLMLQDMRSLRKQAEEQKREALVPDFNVLGPDGKPFKL